MSKIRVTKEFNFEMAHALYGYDGACKNIHGHSYVLNITVIGKINQDKQNPKLGMVIDFSILKEIVQSRIIRQYDHALLLNGNSPHKDYFVDHPYFEKLVYCEFQPTCENLLLDIAEKINANLPADIKLHHVKLRETASSFAEWYAEDN